MTRRDMCYFIGKRAGLLTPDLAAEAWYRLSIRMEEDMAAMDVPKFIDMITAVRAITIAVKNPSRKSKF